MKAFIINMLDNPQRRQFMEEQLEETGLAAEFIEAIEGKSLSFSEIDYDDSRFKQKAGRGLSLGELACVRSHQKIYKRILDDNLPAALILEDDVKLPLGLQKVINRIASSNLDFDVLLLGHHQMSSREKTTKYKWRTLRYRAGLITAQPKTLSVGAYAYVITLAGVKKLLTLAKQIEFPADWYTGNPEIINVIQVIKPLVGIHHYYSELGTLTDERKRAELESKRNQEVL